MSPRSARPTRPPRRRATYHHGDLKRAMLDATRTLLAARGPEQLGLREVARAVGVDHAAVYRHFADKRALVAGLSEACYRELVATLETALRRVPANDVPARLARLAVAFLRFAYADPARFALMFGPRVNRDGRFPTLDAATQEVLAVLVREMAHGIATGRLGGAKPTDMAIALWSFLQGYADMVLRGRIQVRSPRVAEAYLQTLLAPLLRGLAAPAR